MNHKPVSMQPSSPQKNTAEAKIISSWRVIGCDCGDTKLNIAYWYKLHLSQGI